MKILFLNNYDMRIIHALWKAGEFPGHHLWGASHLHHHGVDLDVIEFERFPFFNNHWRVQRFLGLNQLSMRGLDQQLRTLYRFDHDAIFSACQDHTFLLAKLRALGILRKPLVATIHHPIPRGTVDRYFFSGHDRLICLSEKMRDSLLYDHDLNPNKVVKINWGVDLDFYGPYHDLPDLGQSLPHVISAGKSNRDFNVLVDAVRHLHCQLDIYCSLNSRPSIDPLPDNVSVTVGSRGSNAVSFPEMMEAYSKSQIIAIPLNQANVLSGLTSLLDALAIGRPVIMTRSPYIDIDIEAAGVGIWVDPGDTAGWRSAISLLSSDFELRRDMGRRARQLCEDEYRIEKYSARLSEVFKSL